MEDLQWECFFKEADIDGPDAKMYASLFVKNKVSPSILHLLNYDYLNSMGITAVGDIIRILTYISSLKIKNETVNSTSTEKVVNKDGLKKEMKKKKVAIKGDSSQRHIFHRKDHKYRVTSDEMRRTICKLHDDGHTLSYIAKLLDVKISTTHDIIKKYKTTGKMEADRRGTLFKKLGIEHENAMKDLIRENGMLSLRNISKQILKKYSITVCPATVSKYLKGFSYELKRTTKVTDKGSDPVLIAFRYDYAEKYLNFQSKYSEKEIIFVHEIALSVSMKVSKGRPGAVQNMRQIRSRNYFVCCAMNVEGLLYYCVYRKSANSANSESFLKCLHLLFGELKKKEIFNALLIMDDAISSKTDKIKSTITDSGYAYSFLPPQSPFLNPVENMFSKWKEIIMQSVPNSELDLFMSMCNAKNEITEQDTKECYRRMNINVQKCIKKECIDC